MSNSLRSEPRRIRAARRAGFPDVRAREPAAGRHHPASVADVREALALFGAEAYYGVHSVDLVPAPANDTRLPLGRSLGRGRIVLFDQAPSPWRLGFVLERAARERLLLAGADVEQHGVVVWRGDTLRRFMIGHVLAHELGHHMLQHERRLRSEEGARTRDHEARAEIIAARLRARLR